MQIDVREYQSDNQNWTIQNNCQHKNKYTRRRITKQRHNTICVGHHYVIIHDPFYKQLNNKRIYLLR